MLRIIVEGASGEGKTAAARLIDLAMELAGWPHQVKDTVGDQYPPLQFQRKLLAVRDRLEDRGEQVLIEVRPQAPEPRQNP